MKKAFITGVTGQDGSYLAELLLQKGYSVHGLVRRASSSNLERICHLTGDFHLHEGDLSDSANLGRIISEVLPDEVYNLGAMSHVKTSFEMPEYTADVDGVGVLRLLEAIKRFVPKARFYQASTSELFGKIQDSVQSEKTPFYPRSPYGVAKLYAYWICVNYREAYNIFTCNGILFNHESPRRGENFVSRKVTLAVAKIKYGLQDKVVLGNLDARRDWGFAGDFVEGMWRMLQQEKPDDFVLATGKSFSVKDFVKLAFKEIGVDLAFEGKGVQEKGIDKKSGKVLVEVSPEFFRPSEVDVLHGDFTKAKNLLGWEPKTSLADLVKMMMKSDLAKVAKS